MPDMYAPPDASTGSNPMSTLSTLMGIKQKKQEIERTALGMDQTRQAMQGQAADVQMKQQAARQAQAAGSFFQNFDLSKHVKDDGTLDLDSAMTSPEFRAAGSDVPDLVQKLVGIKNAQLTAKSTLADVNGKVRSQFQQTVGGLATDPDVVAGNPNGKAKVQGAISDFAQGGDDNARIANVYGHVFQSTPPEKLASTLRNSQLQAQSAGDQADRTKDTATPIQSADPNTVNFVNTNTLSAHAPGTVVGSTRQGIAPTDTIGYKRSAAAANAEGAQGAGNDEQLYRQIKAGADQSAQIKSLASDVSRLAGEVQTGKYSKDFASAWSTLKQTMGIKSTADDADTRRQLLGKMAYQLRIKAEVAAGASTDAARSTTADAMPNPDGMAPSAIQEAARYVSAQSDVAKARGNNAERHRKQNGGTSTGLSSVDSGFTRDADPRAYEYQSLPDADKSQFLHRMFTKPDGTKDKAAAADFASKIDRLNYHGAPP